MEEEEIADTFEEKLKRLQDAFEPVSPALLVINVHNVIMDTAMYI